MRSHTQWGIIEYEVKMLHGLRALLGSRARAAAFDVELNAFVESACLHTRLLCDCFLPTPPDGDDVWLNRLLTEQELKPLAGLREQLAQTYTHGKPSIRVTLNKRVMHPSRTVRELTYDYSNELDAVYPLLMRIWNGVCTIRKLSAAEVSLSSSPFFNPTAKTSS